MIEFLAPENRIIRVTDRVTDRVTVTLSDGERLILGLLSEDPGYTMQKLAVKANVSRKTVSVRLKTLKEKGFIERVGSDRSGYWKILK